MNKPTYLLLLLLLGVKLFNLVIFTPLFNKPWSYATILAVFLYYGYNKWGKHNRCIQKDLKYWYWIIIGICSSIIPMYINIGQNPIHTIWIYRSILIVFCSFPVLLSIGITYQDVINATFKFSIIYSIAFIIIANVPTLKVGTLDDLGYVKSLEDDYGYTLDGYDFILFPLYSYIKDYTEHHKPSKKLLLKIILLFLLIYFIQNRSILFPAILLGVLGLCKNNKFRIITIFCIIMLFLVPTLNPIRNLINQTQKETTSESYNRNIAYTYFLSENFSSFPQMLFGHGIESSHITNRTEYLDKIASMGVYNSDVGFLGFMNTYGIIPIIIFIILLLKPIIHWNSYPMDVKFMAIHILICSITISYFESFAHAMWFILFLIIMKTCNNKYSNKKKKNTYDFHSVTNL